MKAKTVILGAGISWRFPSFKASPSQSVASNGSHAAGELLVKWANGPESDAAAIGNSSATECNSKIAFLCVSTTDPGTRINAASCRVHAVVMQVYVVVAKGVKRIRKPSSALRFLRKDLRIFDAEWNPFVAADTCHYPPGTQTQHPPADGERQSGDFESDRLRGAAKAISSKMTEKTIFIETGRISRHLNT